jgi:TRAP-type C4-dicarboxylate transport system substrate-binding protein
VQIATVKALGADPALVAFSEIYNALNQKVIDVWMNDALSFTNLKTYEVAPYSTELPLFASTQVCLISKKAFDALSPENQKIVRKVYDEEMPGIIRASWDQNKVLLDNLIKNGFKEYNVIEDATPFFNLVQTVYNDYVKQYPDSKKYIDAVNKLR